VIIFFKQEGVDLLKFILGCAVYGAACVAKTTDNWFCML
jgi:hypothetical protein